MLRWWMGVVVAAHRGPQQQIKLNMQWTQEDVKSSQAEACASGWFGSS